jgi:hypothetical protein
LFEPVALVVLVGLVELAELLAVEEGCYVKF